MRIAGIVKASFIDYPGKLSTVIFTGGCNLQCGYCHNPDIVKNQGGQIAEEEFLAFLDKRKRFLDAVCISGGEPTIQDGLLPLMRKIRQKDYLIKLDTNGTRPDLLKKMMEEKLVSYVAMDVKGPFHRYGEICSASSKQISDIKESVSLLLDPLVVQGVDYEFRTTVCRNQLSPEDLLLLAKQLSGAKRLYLQPFQNKGKLLAPEVEWCAYSPEEMDDLARSMEQIGVIEEIKVR